MTSSEKCIHSDEEILLSDDEVTTHLNKSIDDIAGMRILSIFHHVNTVYLLD